jgi:hypothetical protein
MNCQNLDYSGSSQVCFFLIFKMCTFSILYLELRGGRQKWVCAQESASLSIPKKKNLLELTGLSFAFFSDFLLY